MLSRVERTLNETMLVDELTHAWMKRRLSDAWRIAKQLTCRSVSPKTRSQSYARCLPGCLEWDEYLLKPGCQGEVLAENTSDSLTPTPGIEFPGRNDIDWAAHQVLPIQRFVGFYHQSQLLQ